MGGRIGVEALLVVLFDKLIEGAGELAAIIGEDILYGEREYHLDQLGEAGNPLAIGSRHGQGKGQAANVVDGGKDVVALSLNEQDHGIKDDTMAPRIGVRRFLPQRLRCLGLTGFRLRDQWLRLSRVYPGITGRRVSVLWWCSYNHM